MAQPHAEVHDHPTATTASVLHHVKPPRRQPKIRLTQPVTASASPDRVSVSSTMYALILAGGRGERLRSRTDSVLKPMILAAGRPILWHQVRWLREAGVTDVIFLVGHLAHVVTAFG